MKCFHATSDCLILCIGRNCFSVQLISSTDVFVCSSVAAIYREMPYIAINFQSYREINVYGRKQRYTEIRNLNLETSREKAYIQVYHEINFRLQLKQFEFCVRKIHLLQQECTSTSLLVQLWQGSMTHDSSNTALVLTVLVLQLPSFLQLRVHMKNTYHNI